MASLSLGVLDGWTICGLTLFDSLDYLTANIMLPVGGLLTLVLGLSIAQIKHISAVNLLPALVLIWPSSWLFGQWIG